jgi:hypothetical protein
VRIAAASGADRIVVLDSLTHCETRVSGRDVVVSGSFSGALAFGFALEVGVRGLIAHDAGVGRDAAGVSGLPLADRLGLPAAAVGARSARIGDGESVYRDGVISHVNAVAAALGVSAAQPAADAAHAMLAAPPGAPAATPLVNRERRTVVETPRGRIVLLESMNFAGIDNRGDVLCAGSHGGRVNIGRLLEVRPRGAIFSDGGGARDGSGADGVRALDEVGVAAAAVDAMTAWIGDPESTWRDGIISVVNDTARRAGVVVGQSAMTAARTLLARRCDEHSSTREA